jgi:hypothetical protein
MARDVKRAVEMCVDVAPARDFTPDMKFFTYLAAMLAVLSTTGCIFGKHEAHGPPPRNVDLSAPTNVPAATNTFLVTPDERANGRVASVNENLQFVVLSFPLGQLPPVGSHMNVFRDGAIVGEIKISLPQRDDNSAADIIFGDAKKGDEVRMK